MTPSRGLSGRRVSTPRFVIRSEDLQQLLPPVAEYPLHIPFDGQPVHHGAAPDGVPDRVLADRTLLRVAKAMRVDPEAVRSLDLPVDESMGRLPGRDFTDPPDRHAAKAQTVFDPGSHLHPDGPGRHHLESEPGRGQPSPDCRRRRKRERRLKSGERLWTSLFSSKILMWALPVARRGLPGRS